MSLISQDDPFKDIGTCRSGTSRSFQKNRGGIPGGLGVDGGGVLQLFEARGKVTKQAGTARCLEQVMLAICS